MEYNETTGAVRIDLTWHGMMLLKLCPCNYLSHLHTARVWHVTLWQRGWPPMCMGTADVCRIAFIQLLVLNTDVSTLVRWHFEFNGLYCWKTLHKLFEVLRPQNMLKKMCWKILEKNAEFYGRVTLLWHGAALLEHASTIAWNFKGT